MISTARPWPPFPARLFMSRYSWPVVWRHRERIPPRCKRTRKVFAYVRLTYLDPRPQARAVHAFARTRPRTCPGQRRGHPYCDNERFNASVPSDRAGYLPPCLRVPSVVRCPVFSIRIASGPRYFPRLFGIHCVHSFGIQRWRDRSTRNARRSFPSDTRKLTRIARINRHGVFDSVLPAPMPGRLYEDVETSSHRVRDGELWEIPAGREAAFGISRVTVRIRFPRFLRASRIGLSSFIVRVVSCSICVEKFLFGDSVGN